MKSTPEMRQQVRHDSLAELRTELAEKVLTLRVSLRCATGEEFWLALAALADRVDVDTDADIAAVHALGYLSGAADALGFGDVSDMIDV